MVSAGTFITGTPPVNLNKRFNIKKTYVYVFLPLKTGWFIEDIGMTI